MCVSLEECLLWDMELNETRKSWWVQRRKGRLR